MTLQTIETVIKHWVTFIKAHEKLIIIFVAAGLLFHFGEKGLALWDEHDKRNASIAEKQLTDVQTANKALDAQLADLKAQVAAATAAAEQAKALLRQELQKRIEVDKNLPLPELGQRWEAILSLPPDSITATNDNKMSVSSEAAHTTVQELEKVPALTEELVQTEAELKGCQQLSAQKDLSLTGKDAEIVAEKKAREEDAKVAKDNERKAGRKWFKIGFVSGVAVVIGAKIASLWL